jgi:repressor LexA
MPLPTCELSTIQLKTFRSIKKYLDEHGFPPTVNELAEQLGRTKSSIHANIDALITKGFLKRTVGKARSIEIIKLPQATVIDVVAIPMLGSVPAGVPITADDQQAGEILVEASLVGRDACFALRVSGDSMNAADIIDGDTLVVRQQPLAANGEIVVASIDGEVTVKRLSMHEGHIRLLPENKAFKPIDVTHANDFRILGKVIATRRVVAVTE